MFGILSHLGLRDSALLAGSFVALLASIGWAYFDPRQELLNALGLIGSIASICGILFTFFQVIDAKALAAQARDASSAAKAASEATTRQMRNQHYRFSLHTARRLIAEIRLLVIARSWQLAAIRADDLRDHAGQLAHLRPLPDQDWIQLRDALSAWAILFREGQGKRRLDYNQGAWAELCNSIGDKIDRENDPLE